MHLRISDLEIQSNHRRVGEEIRGALFHRSQPPHPLFRLLHFLTAWQKGPSSGKTRAQSVLIEHGGHGGVPVALKGGGGGR